MSLEERAKTGSFIGTEIKGQCTLMAAREKMSKSEQEALDLMLSTWTNRMDIYRALQSEGYKVGQTTVLDHMGGRCHCVIG